MSEKNMKPSRIYLCLITISMFLLIFSSVFLFQSCNTSFISGSVFKQIIVNNSSVYFRPDSNRNRVKPPSHTYVASLVDSRTLKSKSLRDGCRGSSTIKEIRTVAQRRAKICNTNQALLKVYMYDLPSEFHFGLLSWKGRGGQKWPNVTSINHIPIYPGGLNLQHSIEYWLTLDLLSSNSPGIARPCSAVRVDNSSQADVIFVPFFSSLSYNRHSKLHGREKISVNRMLQRKLVEFLMNRDEWKRRGGKDHIIVAHHPNSMLDVRGRLGSAMFVLADFGRYPASVANVEKDIIAPYRHVVMTASGDSSSFNRRPILVYFQGAIYRKDGGYIRQELYNLLRNEKDVHFTFGTVRGGGINTAGEGMASSKFCLNIAGDTPSSNRLFDAIASQCVPVIISDEIELPFEDVLDYSKFCIFVRSSDAVKKGFLLKLLRGVKREKWTKMWERLKVVAWHFEYQYPSQAGDAVEMIWEAVSRKMSSVRFRLHRGSRFRRFELVDKIN
ncbi:hypothetical protein GIB67_012044 [Kingdonia uniflora]|uniref:Exostosin GT47 domain-containing protein n=1 Tax=Kingdonia uniflora TaxID=39325 RepID=A0A7J7M073_9MAGN|nr:hypothetical protein GIB67_012044 [Kingdonia uniflora]